MSCLLPFPYTPKPNEQHGAHPAAVAPLSLLLRSVLLHQTPYFLHFQVKSFLHAVFSLSLVTRFSLGSALHPSFKPSINPSLLSRSLCSQSQRSPRCGLTTEKLAASDLAWPHRLRSELSLSNGIYTQSNT